MGSSGVYFPSNPEKLTQLIQQARDDASRQRLESDVNAALQRLLAKYNARDADQIREYLDDLEGILSEGAEFERLLFGGSVGKHTFVEGLSDVDALVVLDRKEYAGQSPKEILNSFFRTLDSRLTRDKVVSVTKGKLAVTIAYRDGTEIQLLPAIRSGSTIAIPTPSGKGWNETNPKAFGRALTRANDRLNQSLVPTIKLVKGLVGRFTPQKRMTGYHVEALCLDVVKGYRRAKTVKALLLHVLDKGSDRVLKPIRDVTKQSRIVDEYLGKPNSAERRLVADALATAARQLKNATNVEQWQRVLLGNKKR